MSHPCWVLILLALFCTNLSAQPIRILTWEGYITQADLSIVNKQLADQGYQYTAQVIDTLAQDEEQMFSIIRNNQCDIAFLTLFFIKMNDERISKLLQPINRHSPRLTNYQFLNNNLINISMGMEAGNPLYIPWGGGIYGFYINTQKLGTTKIPTSVSDLWQAIGHHPFEIQTLTEQGDRQALKALMAENGLLERKLRAIYQQAGNLWAESPLFSSNLDIVSSWGPEISQQNKKGENWQLIDFQEGYLAWLDTINFVHHLSGRKLEAAEIIANYFISKKVQQRIADDLSMIPAANISNRGLLEDNPGLFSTGLFVPPFNHFSYSLMKQMVERATSDLE